MYLSTALLTIALIFIRTPPIYGFHSIARIEPINKSVKPMKDPPHKGIKMIKNYEIYEGSMDKDETYEETYYVQNE
jgi:hypothetical protein